MIDIFRYSILRQIQIHRTIWFERFRALFRTILGFSITRVTCLRLIGGGYCSIIAVAQSVLYSLLGLEVIVLISSASLFVTYNIIGNKRVYCRYRKLKILWFRVVVFASFTLSGWCVYKSWTPEEDVPVIICIPPTALTKEVNKIRSMVSIKSNSGIIDNFSFYL